MDTTNWQTVLFLIKEVVAVNSELITTIYNSSPVLEFCDRFNGMSPKWNYAKHKHPYIELIYRLNGKGSTDVLGIVQNFTLFDVIVYPVNCLHQDRCTANVINEAYCIWANIPGVELEHPIQVKDRNGKLEYLFGMIYLEFHREEASKEILALLLKALLLQILRCEKEVGPTAMDRITQYIDTHMTEKISLEHLANMEHISKSYLSKQFKEKTGMTVIEYVNHVRIKTAKMMLITLSGNVEEIAFAVGFESPKYFYRIFKSVVGISPSAFVRKMDANAENNSEIDNDIGASSTP